MSTLVIPWRGNNSEMLKMSITSAVSAHSFDQVLVVGAFEEDARIAMHQGSLASDVREVELHWASNPVYPVRWPLVQTNAAMRVACELDWVSDPFIWAADDLFWPSRKVLLNELVGMSSWILGKAAVAPRLGQGIHGMALQATLDDLVAAGWNEADVHDFEGHWPLAVGKNRMLRAMDFSPNGQKRSTYGNLLVKETGLEVEKRQDIKLFRGVDLPAGKDMFVSTSAGITEDEVDRWMRS